MGNLGRNTFGPGYWAADTSIFKTFRVSDRFQMQFGQKPSMSSTIQILTSAELLGPANGNNLNNPQFGQAGGTSNPRNLQFGLKLSF